MDLSFRKEEHKEADKKRVEMFCERHASSFICKDPEEIIRMAESAETPERKN